jgi:hypothetical protein
MGGVQGRQPRIVDMLYGARNRLTPAFLDLLHSAKISIRGVRADPLGRILDSAVEVGRAAVGRKALRTVPNDNGGHVAVWACGIGCADAGETAQQQQRNFGSRSCETGSDKITHDIAPWDLRRMTRSTVFHDALMRRAQSPPRLRLAVELVPLNDGFVPEHRRSRRNRPSFALVLPP